MSDARLFPKLVPQLPKDIRDVLIQTVPIGETTHCHTFWVFPPILGCRQLPLEHLAASLSEFLQLGLRSAATGRLPSGSKSCYGDCQKVCRGLSEPRTGCVQTRLLRLDFVLGYACVFCGVGIVQGVRLDHCRIEASFGFRDGASCVRRQLQKQTLMWAYRRF